MDNTWQILLHILILLGVAMALGGLCERLRQNALVGYLLAGILLGPKVLDLVHDQTIGSSVAELGVALLLFTIGLEFSWPRLRRMGRSAVGGGLLQVGLTGILGAAVCRMVGLSNSASLAVGMILSMSSTACVLRLLIARTELDTLHGRNALGILLLQDIAVVPLVVFVTLLGNQGGLMEVIHAVGKLIGGASLLLIGLYLCLNFVVPPLLGAEIAARNRDLPILLAIVTAVGAAAAAHGLQLSPALGAFAAGMILGESPFATQIRADVGPLRTLFVTLFFGSIGMLGDPAWAVLHWGLLVAVVPTIMVGKTLAAAVSVRLFGTPPGHALATGVCLAQVGEFSFVLATVGQQHRLLDDDIFNLIVSATLVTLIATPYLVAIAPRLGRWFDRRHPTLDAAESCEQKAGHEQASGDRVILIGFGPAGQRVAEGLLAANRKDVLILELNPKTAHLAQDYGLPVHIGDATSSEVLEHAGVSDARAVVITLPDPTANSQVVALVRTLSPKTQVVVRARYHLRRWELMMSGAHVVIDEEVEVGRRLAQALEALLSDPIPDRAELPIESPDAPFDSQDRPVHP